MTQKQISNYHKVGIREPNDLISFIDVVYPQYKGLCIYDAENKCLVTKNPEIADFHFDAIHGVLNIRGFKSKTNIMEKYIMTFENGEHYFADKVTAEDENAVSDGILSVIRCSDQKELLPTGEWQELPRWGQE